MAPSSLLPGLLLAALCLVESPARAGSAHTTFVVQTQILDACSVAIDGHSTSTAEPTTLHAACTSGGAGTSGIGPNGATPVGSRGPLMRVTTARSGKSAAGGPSLLIVTLSF